MKQNKECGDNEQQFSKNNIELWIQKDQRMTLVYIALHQYTNKPKILTRPSQTTKDQLNRISRWQPEEHRHTAHRGTNVMIVRDFSSENTRSTRE